jgi:AcrR family transcriptional regulator
MLEAPVARDTRERMVRSAVQLLREKGYNGTGLRDVLADSDAPRGSIYHHFAGGKAELGVSALIEAGQFIGTAANAAMQDVDVVDGVRRFLAWWTDYVEETDFRAGCPVVAVAAEFHPEAPQLTGMANMVFAAWQDGLAARLRAAGLNQRKARDLAALIIAAIEGATVMCRARGDREPLVRVRRQLTDAVRAAVAAA